jgi:hypothetical protein
MFYRLDRELTDYELRSFTSRDLEVLKCVYRFSLNVLAANNQRSARKIGTQSVETFGSRDRAVARVAMIRLAGGRAALYAVRRSTSGDWYCHVTPELVRSLSAVDGPELEPMSTGTAWLPLPKKKIIRARLPVNSHG